MHTSTFSIALTLTLLTSTVLASPFPNPNANILSRLNHLSDTDNTILSEPLDIVKRHPEDALDANGNSIVPGASLYDLQAAQGSGGTRGTPASSGPDATDANGNVIVPGASVYDLQAASRGSGATWYSTNGNAAGAAPPLTCPKAKPAQHIAGLVCNGEAPDKKQCLSQYCYSEGVGAYCDGLTIRFRGTDTQNGCVSPACVCNPL